MALIPVSWVERRDEERQQDGDEIFFPGKAARPYRPAPASEARISAISASTFSRVVRSSTRRRLGVTAADGAGLSGTVISNRPKASAGTASMPSIHCQSWGIPHDPVIGQVGDDDAQHDVELEEGHETPAPVRRGDLGDIPSAPRPTRAPTANPPTKRKNMNEYQLTITALPTAEIRRATRSPSASAGARSVRQGRRRPGRRRWCR